MIRKVVTFIVAMSVSLVSSATIQTQGNVKGFFINKSGTALLKLTVNTEECGTNGSGGWDFQYQSVNPTDALLNQLGNQWTSMILAARMANTEIRFGYEPAASVGGYCKLTYIYFYTESM
jgi:hypothetical protein